MTVRGGSPGLPGTASTAPVGAAREVSPLAGRADPREHNTARLAQLMGRPHAAQLLSRFDDGSFLVRIQDAAVRAHLPPGTRAAVGDTLTLTLASLSPRPTFLLGEPPTGAAASLSPAARLVDGLLQRQAGETPPPLPGRTPLLTAPGADPARLAASLGDALEFSGLFYESHLAQWAGGARSLAQILREPKARAQAGNTPASQSDRADSVDAVPDDRQAAIRPEPDPAAARPGAGAGSDHLLRLQLDTLEQRRLSWQGELWPGQPLEWDIEERQDQEPQAGSGEEGPQRAWQSVLRLDLPALGCIEATLQLAGDRLQVAIRAADAESATALRAQRTDLAAALEAAGITPDLFTVRHGA